MGTARVAIVMAACVSGAIFARRGATGARPADECGPILASRNLQSDGLASAVEPPIAI